MDPAVAVPTPPFEMFDPIHDCNGPALAYAIHAPNRLFPMPKLEWYEDGLTIWCLLPRSSIGRHWWSRCYRRCITFDSCPAPHEYSGRCRIAMSCWNSWRYSRTHTLQEWIDDIAAVRCLLRNDDKIRTELF
jgi:hypothetical protein